MLFFRLMELAVQAPPLPYDALIRSTRPREISPIPPVGDGRPRRAAVNDAPVSLAPHLTTRPHHNMWYQP
jgi:hypothetical protein